MFYLIFYSPHVQKYNDFGFRIILLLRKKYFCFDLDVLFFLIVGSTKVHPAFEHFSSNLYWFYSHAKPNIFTTFR